MTLTPLLVFMSPRLNVSRNSPHYTTVMNSQRNIFWCSRALNPIMEFVHDPIKRIGTFVVPVGPGGRFELYGYASRSVRWFCRAVKYLRSPFTVFVSAQNSGM